MIEMKYGIFRQWVLILAAFFVSGAVWSQSDKIDISGEWRFGLDRQDAGVVERWFSQTLSETITLPGSMAENFKGDDVTLHTQWTASIYDSSFFYNPRLEKFRQPDYLKLPFWLTPNKYYVGVAWYQRDVVLPDSWKGEVVTLFLERPHTESRVWINNTEVGMQNSLSVPHVFDVTKHMKPGRNVVSIRIDNRTKDIDVGKDSHSITDQTQGNWNGIVGRMELYKTPATYIDDIQVFPNLQSKTALLKVWINGKTAGKLTIDAKSFNSSVEHTVSPVTASFKPVSGKAYIELELPLGDKMLTWDEFDPALYKLTATLAAAGKEHKKQVQFGMREFKIADTYFYVNGNKTFLRGTVENCVFPLTGYAPMDVESWERVFRICREFGLNHMRFHSFCPPEAAFIAADLVGFYLQPEGPSWTNHGTSLGDGLPIDDYLMEETKRITKQYGNYSSFTMLACGNEPRGRWVAWVSKFVDYWKATDSRRVYTGASVGGSWAWQPRNEFHVKAGARGLAWDKLPESNSDFLPRIDTVKQPYVSHETGQWCVFPDFSEIKRYTGVMRARNFELFREDLSDRGMEELGHDFMLASGKLQALCYKHEIEKTLRTPKYAGMQLLSLNDYSGQGTALVGVLNAFWEEKGYINAEQFRRFCAPTVLLSRMDKFVFKNNETMTARIELSNFFKSEIKNGVVDWKITENHGKIVAKGSFAPQNFEIGNCQQVGDVSFALADFATARKLNLEVRLNGTDVLNDWDFWVYPQTLPVVDTTDIYICNTLDSKAKEQLKNGGKVLLLTAGNVAKGSDVVQYMAPAFWNTSWFKMRPPHTVGLLINDNHPLMKNFPTESYSTLQWWELVQRAQVMELTDMPKGFQPIVQSIDTWFINRKLGMLFEAQVGAGKLVVCSADLRSDLTNRPVAAQLYYSILNYMNSNLFVPEFSVSESAVTALEKERGESLDTRTEDAPDEIKMAK